MKNNRINAVQRDTVYEITIVFLFNPIVLVFNGAIYNDLSELILHFSWRNMFPQNLSHFGV